MKLKSLLSLIALALLSIDCAAQNRLLALQKGDSIGSIHRQSKDDDYGTPEMDYNIPPTPVVIRGAFPFEVNFRQTANEAVNNFQFQHLDNHYIDEAASLSLRAQITLLGNSDYEYTTPADWNAKAASIKDKIISSKILQEAIYTWLLPVYQKAFAEMSVPEQNAFLDIFRNGIKYIDTVNLAKEKLLVDTEPWTFIETRGDMNAFIYRRISKNELTGDECRKWLERVITDFESVMRKNPRPEDDYVVTSELNEDYVLAAPWSMGGNYSSEFSQLVVMRKTKTSYELIPARFRTTFYTEDHIAVGWSEDTTQHTSMFIYDSLGYTFCNSQYQRYCYYHQFLGQRKNQSVMLVSGWEKFPDQQVGEVVMACCAFIDVDSGTVLRDTVWLPAIVDDGYYTHDYTFPGFIANRIIYYNPDTQLYGMIDERGHTLLPATYKSIERTDDPDIVLVNGKKKVSVFGGRKPPKTKKK